MWLIKKWWENYWGGIRAIMSGIENPEDIEELKEAVERNDKAIVEAKIRINLSVAKQSIALFIILIIIILFNMIDTSQYTNAISLVIVILVIKVCCVLWAMYYVILGNIDTVDDKGINQDINFNNALKKIYESYKEDKNIAKTKENYDLLVNNSPEYIKNTLYKAMNKSTINYKNELVVMADISDIKKAINKTKKEINWSIVKGVVVAVAMFVCIAILSAEYEHILILGGCMAFMIGFTFTRTIYHIINAIKCTGYIKDANQDVVFNNALIKIYESYKIDKTQLKN